MQLIFLVHNMTMRFKIVLCLLLLGSASRVEAGKNLRVLFIGNSYTAVNNLPGIVAEMAAAMGDTLVWDMAAPGGANIAQHFYDPATLAKIQAGNWDYVVLQEQSLAPAMPDALGDPTFLYARMDSLVNLYSPCSETMFYMTWGRKNGLLDYCALYSGSPYYWPHFCTYDAMDSVIRLRYRMWAAATQGVVAPAGAVWHYIRDNYPSIELYDADESHPSPAGSYAAACCFYTALFKKDPTLLTYDYSISAADAAHIRTAVKSVAYDSMLYWHIDQYRTEARFTHTVTAATASFTGTAANAASFTWSFGDGQTAVTPDPVHTYNAPGIYNVQLVAYNNNTGCADTAYAVLTINTTGIDATHTGASTFNLSPNPATHVIRISAATFLSGKYQLSLMNEQGQTIHTQQSIAAQQQTIDLAAYPSGIYLLSITKAGNMIYRGKVVKR